jgi:hypothetical protein
MQQLVETVEHPIGFLLLAGQRVANNALAFAAETDPDFEQLLRVGGEGGGVLLVLDLLQGLTIYHNGTSSFKTSLKSSANISKGCGVDNAFGHRSPVTFPLTPHIKAPKHDERTTFLYLNINKIQIITNIINGTQFKNLVLVSDSEVCEKQFRHYRRRCSPFVIFQICFCQ